MTVMLGGEAVMLKYQFTPRVSSKYAMAKCSVQTTSFGTVLCEAEGCIYANPKDKYQQLIERFMLVLN